MPHGVAVADELIAAKLNIANGTNGSVIATTIVTADNWLSTNPLGSHPSDPARLQGLASWGTLDAYNDGWTGPGDCGPGD